MDTTEARTLELVLDSELMPVIGVSLAMHSDSNFYVGFDGEIGVFCATYQTLPIGTRVSVVMHLPGGLALDRDAVVAFAREASEDEGAWPGLFLRFERLDPFLDDRMRSFMRFREPLFAATIERAA